MLDAAYAQTLMKSRNMRMTPQRRAVIEFLVDNTDHPVVEDVAVYVHSKMPNVALSTIYNILHELTDLGLIAQVNVGGVMHFDPENRMHAHLRCSSCGTLVDVALPTDVERVLQVAVEDSGSQFSSSSIDVTGICPDCGGRK